MLKSYIDYLSNLNNRLTEKGILLPLDLTIDSSKLYEQVVMLEQYFYFNHVLSVLDSGFAVRDLLGYEANSLYDLARDEALGRYRDEGVGYSESLGSREVPIQVLTSKRSEGICGSIFGTEVDDPFADSGTDNEDEGDDPDDGDDLFDDYDIDNEDEGENINSDYNENDDDFDLNDFVDDEYSDSSLGLGKENECMEVQDMRGISNLGRASPEFNRVEDKVADTMVGIVNKAVNKGISFISRNRK